MPARRFTIPMLPWSKNEWHRGTTQGARIQRAHIKKVWEQFVWARVNEEPRMPRPLRQVTCSLGVAWDKPGPLPDFHNLEMAHECIADGLVKAGIILDDSKGQYVRGPIDVRKATDVLKPGTLVLLEWDEDGIIDPQSLSHPRQREKGAL